MGISSVSYTSSIGISSGSNSNDSSQLENEITSIQQQIKQENLSKDDEKTKQIKIQQLENKLQQLESQIKQKQSQKTDWVKIGDSNTNDSSNSSNKNNIIDILA